MARSCSGGRGGRAVPAGPGCRDGRPLGGGGHEFAHQVASRGIQRRNQAQGLDFARGDVDQGVPGLLQAQRQAGGGKVRQLPSVAAWQFPAQAPARMGPMSANVGLAACGRSMGPSPVVNSAWCKLARAARQRLNGRQDVDRVAHVGRQIEVRRHDHRTGHQVDPVRFRHPEHAAGHQHAGDGDAVRVGKVREADADQGVRRNARCRAAWGTSQPRPSPRRRRGRASGRSSCCNRRPPAPAPAPRRQTGRARGARAQLSL